MDAKTEKELIRSISHVEFSTENLHTVSVEMLDVLQKIALTLKSMDNNIAKLVKLRPIT